MKLQKADLPKIINYNGSHLIIYEHNKLLHLLLLHKDFFHETLGDWQIEPENLTWIRMCKPYNCKAFPIYMIHMDMSKKEVSELKSHGVLEHQPNNELDSKKIIIPNKNRTNMIHVWF